MIPRSLLALLLIAYPASASERVLDPKMHHLRSGTQREWDDFPEKAEGPALTLRFEAKTNREPGTLRWRQQDVKQLWRVLLNGKETGRLVPDENDQVIAIPLASGRLQDGENKLRIEAGSKLPDDIRIGEIWLDDRAPAAVLSEATLEVTVGDADHAGAALPCRLTIVNARGALAALAARAPDGHVAVRPGVVYTSNGRATIGLPAGKYTIHAGRGFAYGIDSATVTLKAGQTVQKKLSIRREVLTPGYASCDTHVHTLTYSGHGDATLDERMVTLAGENIELPIATDHNVQVTYDAAAKRNGVERYFTPVVGNEVTTAVGHFCSFPLPADGTPPDHKLLDWKGTFDSIRTAGARVIILNHARDLHGRYRPFDPKHHIALTGENLDGWELRANAMEVINSGALQTDDLRLFQDWFGLLNGGLAVAPVGASDSHDVSRYIVGQARTYVRVKADDPGKIDVGEAIRNFEAGRVLVSLGLLADITVNDRYGPADLVPASDKVAVRVRVLGPGWTTAETVTLYANGLKIREAKITDGKKAGVKWDHTWELPAFKQDVFLAAIATGPGVKELYWPIAKPYQPTSPHVNTRVLGATGAIWIDGDGDGKRLSARDYAQRLLKKHGADVAGLTGVLAGYDEAVASQVAGLLQARGVAVGEPSVREAAKKAGPTVARGFEAYFEAWRASQVARGKE